MTEFIFAVVLFLNDGSEIRAQYKGKDLADCQQTGPAMAQYLAQGAGSMLKDVKLIEQCGTKPGESKT